MYFPTAFAFLTWVQTNLEHLNLTGKVKDVRVHDVESGSGGHWPALVGDFPSYGMKVAVKRVLKSDRDFTTVIFFS